MSNRKQMIDVIVSGLSPESYQRMKEKQSLQKNLPLRTSQRNDARKEMINKRKSETKAKNDDPRSINEQTDGSQRKVKLDEFLEGTLNRMQCNDEKRR
jgi:hypothetical protein